MKIEKVLNSKKHGECERNLLIDMMKSRFPISVACMTPSIVQNDVAFIISRDSF